MPISITAAAEVFPASNITNGRYGDTGTAYDWSFWVAPDFQLGSAVIDLQGTHMISGFDIQDMHNRIYYDRGTQAFNIQVSSDGIHYTTVLSSAFSFSDWQNLTILTYTLPQSVQGRYVQFNVESVWYGGYSRGGLNELDVRGSVADTGPTAMLLGIGLAGIGWLRRKLC